VCGPHPEDRTETAMLFAEEAERVGRHRPGTAEKGRAGNRRCVRWGSVNHGSNVLRGHSQCDRIALVLLLSAVLSFGNPDFGSTRSSLGLRPGGGVTSDQRPRGFEPPSCHALSTEANLGQLRDKRLRIRPL